MVLFTVLIGIGITLIILAVLILCLSGTAFMAVFGDFIVCMILIGFIIKLLVRRKRKR